MALLLGLTTSIFLSEFGSVLVCLALRGPLTSDRNLLEQARVAAQRQRVQSQRQRT